MSFSATKYVFGVKITLNQDIVEDTDIGLYNDSDSAELRWITNQVDTTDEYKDGILTIDGIGTIGQEADFINGGNVATIKGFTCSIIGSIDGVPIWEIIRDKGINLIGKQIQIIEFDHSEEPATETVIRTFIIDKINEWSEDSYSFECLSPFHKRNTYLSVQDSNGNTTPVLFGENVFCGLSAKKTDNGIDLTVLDEGRKSGWTRKIYPAVSRTLEGDKYRVYFSTAVPVPSLSDLQDLLDGKVAYIVSGGGNGRYYRINGADVTYQIINQYYSCIGLLLEDSAGDIALISATNTTFIQLKDFIVEYDIDTWKCFYSPLVLYQIINNGLSRLSLLSFQNNNNYNNLVFNNENFSDTNNIANFNIYNRALLMSDDTITPKYRGSDVQLRKRQAGIYDGVPPFSYRKIATDISMDSEEVLNTVVSDKIGKNGDIHYNSKFKTATAPDSVYPLIAVMLEFTDNISAEEIKNKIYAGINYKIIFTKPIVEWTSKMDYYVVPFTRAIGDTFNFSDATPSNENVIYKQITDTETIDFNNIPNYYYTDNTESDSFLVNKDKLLYSHKDNDANKTYRFGLMFLFEAFPGTNYDIDLRIYEAGLFTLKNESIGEKIYGSFNGRIYDDTWNSRKTATALMTSPVDIIEHCKRLERNDIDDVDFGHEYSPSASIDTDSFDSDSLLDTKAIVAGRQITSEPEQWSGEIVSSLCKEFYLCNYQNNLGEESLSYILRDNKVPDVNIELSDIIPSSIGGVEEIGVADIYCEPYFQYAFNLATNKFDKQIKITNTHKSNFDGSYVIGLAGGEAEQLWNFGRALYLKYGIVTQIPEDKASLIWVQREEDAIKLMYNWFRFMGAYQDVDDLQYKAASRKKISFSVPYDISMTIGEERKPWYVSMKMAISLPYHTSSETVYCVVESIDFDLDSLITSITVITYDVIDELQFYVKDTYGTSDGDDWKDTYLTKAEAGTNGNDMKDNT